MLCQVLAINPEIASEVAQSFDFTFSSLISFEEFQMVYFEVFQQVDQIVLEGNAE